MASPYAGAQPPSPAGHQAPPPQQAQQNHSLAFRVMRLSRPSLQPDQAAALRFDPRDVFLPEDALTGPDPSAADGFLQRLLRPADSPATTVPGDFTFRDRFLLRDPADALALPGLLVLPQAFGAIYLGETFCSYISINNSSSFEARDVAIKAEIQTERQRILLLDTSKAPVESIRSGGRYDFIVEHDVKELGAHTLICTALYNDGDGERKYLPQFFKFNVSNPLSVRTKVRTIKDATYLEACIENHTKSNLYMDQVDFEPAQQWAATRLEADEHPSAVKSIIRDLCKQPVLIRAGGGIYNYLYQLRPLSGESGQPKTEGSSILGKFQITWRTNLGEPGRLQTQNIHSTPTASKDIDLRVVKVPPVIFLERPFMVNLCLTNQSDKTVGPFEVFVAPSVPGEEKSVLVNGLQKLILPLVEAFESINFDLSMVATQVGVQKISGITLYAVQEKKLYEPLSDIEIFVDAE
ncbi:trafficking protein particle complex subunit 13 isoform X2 [Oryza brachyantha]|uniref:trafficking protein particle complex subunit 13 isoform X2 n=1 Tax=Oryza brachyantha TaxID=4533 RepID=UPI001ADB65E8|nr:trafficking protein particle complex subunit 13 isoform X2 [Oryza brachyantha]